MIANNLNDNQYEVTEFVEELIHENMDLRAENIRLSCENKRLRERVEDIERFYKIFGISFLIREN